MAKKIIEEGFIYVGTNTIRKTGKNKYEVINSSGKSAYDMISGDNPKREIEERMCSTMSKIRLHNIKKWKTDALESSFSSAVYLLADTGTDTTKLTNHFISGGGTLFTFPNTSNIASEIKTSDEFITFTKDILQEIKKEMTDGSLKKENDDGLFEILRIKNVSLPYYGISSVFGKNDDAAAILGGIQFAIVKYKLYQESNTFTAQITNVYLYDTFGARWDDACNTTKSYANGLVSMFVLQHYRNIGNPQKYQPFVIAVRIDL